MIRSVYAATCLPAGLVRRLFQSDNTEGTTNENGGDNSGTQNDSGGGNGGNQNDNTEGNGGNQNDNTGGNGGTQNDNTANGGTNGGNTADNGASGENGTPPPPPEELAPPPPSPVSDTDTTPVVGLHIPLRCTVALALFHPVPTSHRTVVHVSALKVTFEIWYP